MSLAQANSRTALIGRTTTERYYRRAVRRVARIVEEEGGCFGGLVARTAQYKARSILRDEPDSVAVIAYHATLAAREWEGPADDALQRAVRRVSRAVGTLLEDHAVGMSLQSLLEIAESGHPQALPPEVAERIKRRMG